MSCSQFVHLSSAAFISLAKVHGAHLRLLGNIPTRPVIKDGHLWQWIIHHDRQMIAPFKPSCIEDFPASHFWEKGMHIWLHWALGFWHVFTNLHVNPNRWLHYVSIVHSHALTHGHWFMFCIGHHGHILAHMTPKLLSVSLELFIIDHNRRLARYLSGIYHN